VFAGDSLHLQHSKEVEGEVLRRRGDIAEYLTRNPIRGCAVTVERDTLQ
jgi:hypothetical protein